ncbi:MAG TPA: PIG-L family deacetylase [Rhodocyclaceae bacterium]|nr:PIG-L family deacetylase [Rhodocyclaceae bacterium]
MPFSDLSLPSATPFDLNQLAFAAGLRLCVLAPHPDDFDAISLSLRFFHRQGAEIYLAVLTDGASGVEDGYKDATDNAAKARLREAEQKASCKLFGLPSERVSFLRLPADEKGNPRLDEANHTTIRSYLLKHQPQLVWLPHGNDSNVTHQRTYALFRAVALQEKMQLWAVLNQDAKTIAMRHDLYMPFDARDAEWKASLLRLHDSQQQRNLNTRGHGFDERVLAVNQNSATALGLPATYAEVFELERYE